MDPKRPLQQDLALGHQGPGSPTAFYEDPLGSLPTAPLEGPLASLHMAPHAEPLSSLPTAPFDAPLGLPSTESPTDLGQQGGGSWGLMPGRGGVRDRAGSATLPITSPTALVQKGGVLVGSPCILGPLEDPLHGSGSPDLFPGTGVQGPGSAAIPRAPGIPQQQQQQQYGAANPLQPSPAAPAGPWPGPSHPPPLIHPPIPSGPWPGQQSSWQAECMSGGSSSWAAGAGSSGGGARVGSPGVVQRFSGVKTRYKLYSE